MNECKEGLIPLTMTSFKELMLIHEEEEETTEGRILNIFNFHF